MTPLEAAMDYRDGGWAPIPILQDNNGSWKRPAIAGWDRFSYELPKVPEVMQWWKEYPEAQVGVVCGMASGIVVVDIDGSVGIQTFTDIGGDSKMLGCPITQTGGGGFHLFFEYPDPDVCGYEVKNSVGKIGKGIDVRSTGGFVVAPPSTHVSGGKYCWVAKPWWIDNAAQPNSITIDAIPNWLVDSMVSSDRPNRDAIASGGEAIPMGQRNSTLASYAGAMRRVGMSDGAALAALRYESESRCEEPMGDGELHSIIRSISRYQPKRFGSVGGA